MAPTIEWTKSRCKTATMGSHKGELSLQHLVFVTSSRRHHPPVEGAGDPGLRGPWRVRRRMGSRVALHGGRPSGWPTWLHLVRWSASIIGRPARSLRVRVREMRQRIGNRAQLARIAQGSNVFLKPPVFGMRLAPAPRAVGAARPRPGHFHLSFASALSGQWFSTCNATPSSSARSTLGPCGGTWTRNKVRTFGQT